MQIYPCEHIAAVSPTSLVDTIKACFDHAQEDVAESIDAVREDYPIDDANIILSGFSMGGYGVYRTFFETPKKFIAAAVFAGFPYMVKKI